MTGCPPWCQIPGHLVDGGDVHEALVGQLAWDTQTGERLQVVAAQLELDDGLEDPVVLLRLVDAQGDELSTGWVGRGEAAGFVETLGGAVVEALARVRRSG